MRTNDIISLKSHQVVDFEKLTGLVQAAYTISQLYGSQLFDRLQYEDVNGDYRPSPTMVGFVDPKNVAKLLVGVSKLGYPSKCDLFEDYSMKVMGNGYVSMYVWPLLLEFFGRGWPKLLHDNNACIAYLETLIMSRGDPLGSSRHASHAPRAQLESASKELKVRDIHVEAKEIYLAELISRHTQVEALEAQPKSEGEPLLNSDDQTMSVEMEVEDLQSQLVTQKALVNDLQFQRVTQKALVDNKDALILGLEYQLSIIHSESSLVDVELGFLCNLLIL